MAKFIEVLETGLTVQGKVCRAGEFRQVHDEYPILSKKAQAKRWKKPRYREVTRADFEGQGGAVKGEDAHEAQEPQSAPASAGAQKKETKAAEKPQGGSEEPFAALAGLNVEDTLQAVSEMDEAGQAAFIVWEQANQNRKGVLEPLGVEG